MIDVFSDAQASNEITRIKHCKNVTDILMQHYPGHLWAVQMTSDGSMTDVVNLTLSGNRGFRLHSDKLSGDDLKKKVVRYGGELLERYHVDRGRFNAVQHAELKVDHAGQIIHDAA